MLSAPVRSRLIFWVAAALVVVAILTGYFWLQRTSLSQASLIQKKESRLALLEREVRELLFKRPDVTAVQKLEAKEQDSLRRLEQKLSGFESNALSAQKTAELLSAQSTFEGESIAIDEIQSKARTRVRNWTTENFQMTVASTLGRLTDYLAQLEQNHPFLWIRSFELIQDRDFGAAKKMFLGITVSSLVSDKKEAEWKKKTLADFSLSEDPFLYVRNSPERAALPEPRMPVSVEGAKSPSETFKISKMIFIGRDIYAVIQGQTVGKGALLASGHRVKEIFPDRVVLTQNGIDLPLAL